MANTITKNQTADIPTKNGNKYSYQYVDIAQIHEYLEENNMSYYQYIDRIDNDDYIMTVRIINGEEKQPIRGSRVVDATLFGNDNPAQKQGSALTYARRYSLLMAFGLATEDDDANSLNREIKVTKEEAEGYTFKGGKHEGWTLKKVVEEDKRFLNWLLDNSKDAKLLKCIEVLTGSKPLTEEESDEHLENTQELMELLQKHDIDLEKVCETYKVNRITELNQEQYKQCIEHLRKKYEKGE